MDYFLDIRVRCLPEIAPEHILEKLFGKIHLALAKLGRSDIGLSFPEVDETRPSLGLCLRLHGPEPALRALIQAAGLAGLRDYLKQGEIRPVPSGASFRRVSRVQVKSGLERRRRRLARRHNLSLEEAARRIPDSAGQRSALPFIRLKSQSSDQYFPLFVRHGPELPGPTAGPFNAYGLSQEATIPWF
ncbi:type I-F CRISPR-associated endoribonuclease Cas6/Csy4 [Deltaproteobacteria bacterium]|nr:type I-F CRISPR-associated endoribonuclease Cas6/Csy4 [Deltaproteobacteria bacterium]